VIDDTTLFVLLGLLGFSVACLWVVVILRGLQLRRQTELIARLMDQAPSFCPICGIVDNKKVSHAHPDWPRSMHSTNQVRGPDGRPTGPIFVLDMPIPREVPK
jgi:hypothetical protein